MAYYPSIGLVITIMTIIYILFPKKYFGEKSEYLIFFLCSLSSFWVIYMMTRVLEFKVFENEELFAWASLYVWITITHLLFPFKRIKRNKNFTFLTVCSSIVILILLAYVMLSINIFGGKLF